MTAEFELLMQLTAAGAEGRSVPARNTETIDWDKLIRLAGEQSVLTLAAYGLDLSPELDCPAERRRELKRSMISSAAQNTVRKASVMRFLAQMEEAGFRAVLVKGYAIADCYESPESRLSGDTDVWIRPEEEERACAYLESIGFSVSPRWKNGHHAVCTHPETGIVELHVLLYDEIVEDVWFGKMDGREFVTEEFLRVDTPDGAYTTLGCTDHLIFLALHMIKHFINSGLSLKMMLDTALYLRKYRESIDMTRFWETIGGLHYGVLFNGILHALVKYCGMNADDFPGIADDCPAAVEELLCDLEEGGSMGFNDKKNRESGWYEYNRQMLLKEKSGLQYGLYMLRWKLDSFKKSFFPHRDAMQKQYPCLIDNTWLYPFVWLHRLIFRGFDYLRKGSATKEIIMNEEKLPDSGKKRVELFRRFGMLE